MVIDHTPLRSGHYPTPHAHHQPTRNFSSVRRWGGNHHTLQLPQNWLYQPVAGHFFRLPNKNFECVETSTRPYTPLLDRKSPKHPSIVLKFYQGSWFHRTGSGSWSLLASDRIAWWGECARGSDFFLLFTNGSGPCIENTKKYLVVPKGMTINRNHKSKGNKRIWKRRSSGREARIEIAHRPLCAAFILFLWRALSGETCRRKPLNRHLEMIFPRARR